VDLAALIGDLRVQYITYAINLNGVQHVDPAGNRTPTDALFVCTPIPTAAPDDPRRRQPDISRAKEVLSWEPKWPLEEGLNRTIAQ
jgi:nucleoside-diphosphate-sugar epimerase